jgi:hypothetical protein
MLIARIAIAMRVVLLISTPKANWLLGPQNRVAVP